MGSCTSTYATFVFTPFAHWRSLCEAEDPQPHPVWRLLWQPAILGTLGCLADGKNWGCRWCGFGDYSNVTCPSSTCTFDNEPVTPYYWETWALKTSKKTTNTKTGVLRNLSCQWLLYPCLHWKKTYGVLKCVTFDGFNLWGKKRAIKVVWFSFSIWGSGMSKCQSDDKSDPTCQDSLCEMGMLGCNSLAWGCRQGLVVNPGPDVLLSYDEVRIFYRPDWNGLRGT